MSFFAVSAFDLSLFVHITAVVVGFGSMFAEAIAMPVAMKLDPRHLPYVHKLQLALNRYFATPALVIVLLTGIYQVSEGDFSFGDFWVSASFVIVVAIGGMLGGYLIPADRRLFDMVERDIAAAGSGPVTLSDEYRAAARTEGVVGTIAGVLIIVAIFLMVAKPGM